jgi:hypothetical protein
VALAFLASFSGAGNQKEAPEKPQDGAGADHNQLRTLQRKSLFLKQHYIKEKSF